MDYEPQPYDLADASSADATVRSPRRVPRLAVGAGVTLFFALAGTGLAFAVGGSGGGAPAASFSSSTSSTTSLPPLHPKIGRFGPVGGLWLGLGPGLVHGQFTVRNGNSYKTVEVQMGKVTSVSTESITVTSPDGYSAAYQVTGSTVVDSLSGGIKAVGKGDQVRLEAVLQGSRHTAANIIDSTKVGASRKGFGLRPGGMSGKVGPRRLWSPPTGAPAPA